MKVVSSTTDPNQLSIMPADAMVLTYSVYVTESYVEFFRRSLYVILGIRLSLPESKL